MKWQSKLHRAVSSSPKIASVPETSSAPPLSELREKMARILGQPVAKPMPAGDMGALGFEREETPEGPLYLRTRRFDEADRVGRAGVLDASLADAGMLALLALDPRLSSCDPGRALYLDTETTGLAGGTGTVAFLVGLAFFDEDRRELVVEQLLLRQLGEEAPILDRVKRRIEEASMLVSFNGKAFDMPLLRTRMVMSRMTALADKPHLDLVHIARRLHRKRIGACDLGSIETKILGFERRGDIPSIEIAARYAHYLRTRDEASLSDIILHNDWDIVSMAALVGLYGEPISNLEASDLPAVARTLRRAGSLERAHEMAHAAVLSGGGGEAHRARGEIAKARGDKARALLDFELALGDIDDAGLRLELAKLYEHHAKEPLLALDLVEKGTGESDEAMTRRRERLRAKLEKEKP